MAKILSIEGDSLSVVTAQEKRRQALLALTESYKAKRILKGKIQGVENIDGHPSAILYYENFKIIIPAEFLIEITPVNGKPESQWPEYLLTKRLGSEINYIIKSIDENGGIAIASRMEAMDRIRNDKVYSKAEGKIKIENGSLAEARIVCSTRAGIYVEIFGVETYIPSKELSYQRIQDATIDFPVGEIILVKILDITVDEDGKVKMTASAKQAEENPYTAAMQRYQVGDKYIGKVSMVDKNGVFVALDGGVDVLCQFPKRGVRPTRGTNVTVRITIKNEEQNRLFGSITHTSAAQ